MSTNYMPVFYARCFEEPYTEGHLQILRLMLEALLAQNIPCTVFNYKYGHEQSRHPTEAQLFNYSEAKVPIVSRHEAIATNKGRDVFFTSFFEACKLPVFLRAERRISGKKPIINITNCFRFPRLLAKQFSNTPIVTHVYMREKIGPIDGLLNSSDIVIVTSNTISQYLVSSRGISNEKIRIIHPPVNTEFYQPINKQGVRRVLSISSDELVILYIGNLTPLRFPEGRVLQIISGLRKLNLKVRLHVFASPSIENKQQALKIINQAKSLGLAEIIKIEIKNLKDNDKRLWYNASDLFLFPSMNSSFAVEPPLTILEAMSSGLPVASSNVLSVKEFIEPDVTGFLFDADADPILWTETISRLLSSNHLAKVGLSGRRTVVSGSSIKIIGNKLKTIYEEFAN